MTELEHFIFTLVAIIVLSLLVLFCFETSRKVGNLTTQIKALRQDMLDAGYVPAEPKIMEIKK